MKRVSAIITAAALCAAGLAQAAQEPIKLDEPNLARGSNVMKALADRHSTKTFSPKKLSVADLSDVLWAANGINRKESGKRTAPSAMNRQDIKIYVCTADGAYLYNPETMSLDPVSAEDLRQSGAPATFVLVSDFNDRWSGLDAGIVSQNISVFCSSAGLANYPHTTMDAAKLRKGLKLKDGQTPMICNSVGYSQ